MELGPQVVANYPQPFLEGGKERERKGRGREKEGRERERERKGLVSTQLVSTLNILVLGDS